MSEAEIEYLQPQGMGIWTNSVDLAFYPDGMPIVTTRGGPQDVIRVLMRPQSIEAFVGGLFWIDALVERGHPVPELILPCLPGARQDRLNDTGDYLFTAKSIAKMINERHFPRVVCIDPHSEVMPGLIDRCVSIPAADCFQIKGIHKRQYDAVISPDAGAEKRALKVAQLYGIPVIHAWKTRNVKTGAISGFGIEPHSTLGKASKGKVLVVDDICDGGGTFIGLAERIRTVLNSDADLYVTHGIFSKGTEELFYNYMSIFCTDSLIADREGVSVLPVREALLLKGAL